MINRIGSYPRVRVSGGGSGVVSQAGGVLLVETARRTGREAALSSALAPCRKPRTVHDPGKILLDIALRCPQFTSQGSAQFAVALDQVHGVRVQ